MVGSEAVTVLQPVTRCTYRVQFFAAHPHTREDGEISFRMLRRGRTSPVWTLTSRRIAYPVTFRRKRPIGLMSVDTRRLGDTAEGRRPDDHQLEITLRRSTRGVPRVAEQRIERWSTARLVRSWSKLVFLRVNVIGNHVNVVVVLEPLAQRFNKRRFA
jgi:hypothetical protein